MTKDAPIVLITPEIPRGLGAVSVKMSVLSNIPTILGTGHITVEKETHFLSSWRLNSDWLPGTSFCPDTLQVNYNYWLIED